MSQRERYIVIGTVAVVALFAIDKLFFGPLLERYKTLADDIRTKQEEVDRNDQLLTRASQANRKWKEMTAGALKRDASTTESQLIDSVGQWAQDARMSVSYKPERTEKKKEFIVVTYRATCNGSMSQLRTFLLHVQRATIPIRVTDLQISSRPEGSDNLTISMGISTAYLAPEQDKNERPGTVRPAGASAAAATFNRHRESL